MRWILFVLVLIPVLGFLIFIFRDTVKSAKKPKARKVNKHNRRNIDRRKKYSKDRFTIAK